MSVISASQQKMATATGPAFGPVAKRTQKHEINPNVDPNLVRETCQELIEQM